MIILECNNPDTKKTPAKQAASVCKLSLILSDNSFVQYTHTHIMTLSQILLSNAWGISPPESKTRVFSSKARAETR